MRADQQVVHLIVARTAAGSSARFVAAFACMFLGEAKVSQQMNSGSSGALTDLLSESLSPMTSLNPARSRLMRHSTGSALRSNNSWLEEEHGVERCGLPVLRFCGTKFCVSQGKPENHFRKRST